MASNRHLGRIVALQALYEYDFRKRSGDPDVDVEEIKSSNNEDSKYQELKESEIITVQKFVIKKLVQKITSLEEGKDV